MTNNEVFASILVCIAAISYLVLLAYMIVKNKQIHENVA